MKYMLSFAKVPNQFFDVKNTHDGIGIGENTLSDGYKCKVPVSHKS